MLNIILNPNWNVLLPQIEEVIKEKLSAGWDLEEINKMLSRVDYWDVSPLFKGEIFNYENARFTLQQLMNMVELLTGNDAEFSEVMRLKVKNVVVDIIRKTTLNEVLS
jgi:hypothetical protein